MAGITGVDDIASTVSDGISTTNVIFRMEVPTDQAVQDVKDAIDRVRGDLPASVEEPIVTRVDVEGQAIASPSRSGSVASIIFVDSFAASVISFKYFLEKASISHSI